MRSGTNLGQYRIGDAIGSGGMASVYRAEDLTCGRQVALKVLRAGDVERTERHTVMLRREYHTLAELVHPRIIEVYDFGETDGLPYYTMELLDGSDLTDTAPMDWREACGLIRDVASSLAILHSRGLVHRDVSTRNVRRTADGRAKLLDFGAMQPMGTVKNVVGTPPFMAPEAVLMQSLDGRVDLYSLGALAYYLLTGRHAFPATRISELRDVWRSRPIAPSRLVSEVPGPLSDLVLQLLALDRAGRPASAAEVFARLSATGELPSEEEDHVPRAYLTTPAMVGRQTELVALRRTVLCFVRKVGASLLIRGRAGLGRTRMLDSCAMEAKLLGAQVVRADANDATEGCWGVARRICERLFDLAPQTAERASHMQTELLAHVIPSLGDGSRALPAGDIAVRSQLIRALRDFVLEVAGRAKFAILIDDVDRIDEPSAALLVALAHKAMRCPLLLVTTLDRDRVDQSPAPVAMLDKASEHLDLEPLSKEHTLQLLSSVFGGVGEAHKVVERIAAAAQGNPGAAMTYAQFLVDRGLVRYERGSWALPKDLSPDEMPESVSQALLSRLTVVSEDARELADALALSEEDAPGLSDLPLLTAHRDTSRTFRALDELVAARVLVADSDRYAFAQRPLAAVLRAEMPAQRFRELSRRAAEILDGGDPMRRVLHLLNAGESARAIAVVVELDLQALLPELELLQRILAAAEADGSPPALLHRLRMAVLSKASLVAGSAPFLSLAEQVTEQIKRDCGLAAYAELAHLPDEQRLQAALELTAKRFEAMPEQDRVCAVKSAIGQLARVYGMLTSMASVSVDLALLDRLPDLSPLTPLSPALERVQQIAEMGRAKIQGPRSLCAARAWEVLDRIAQEDRGGLDELQHQRTFLGMHTTLGAFEALIGSSATEKHAELLERDPEMRPSAWLLRGLMFLYQGNVEESRKCHRRAELLRLQHRSGSRYFSALGGLSLHGHVALGDSIAVRDVTEVLEALGRKHLGWPGAITLARTHQLRLSGDPNAAVGMIGPLLSELGPDIADRFCPVAAAYLESLVDGGEFDEAGRRALELQAQIQRPNQWDESQLLRRAIALALHRAGDHAGAADVLDVAIDVGQRRGLAGLALGRLLELRARIALSLEDRRLFDRHVQRCALEYDRSNNPRLGVRLAALVEESRHDADDLPKMIGPHTDTQQAELRSRMLECVDLEDRSRCALTMLLQSMNSQEGSLYGVSAEGTVTLLASVPEAWTGDGMEATLREYLTVERALLASGSLGITQEQLEAPVEEADTQTEEPKQRSLPFESSGYLNDGEGRQLEPFAMVAPGEPQRIAAVLLRPVDSGGFARPSPALLSQVAGELVARNDVVGLPLDM
ncbi:MAG: protein kinase [Myxococcales bacterium]|nr:protein kinase [Myxococcales bacterium]